MKNKKFNIIVATLLGALSIIFGSNAAHAAATKVKLWNNFRADTNISFAIQERLSNGDTRFAGWWNAEYGKSTEELWIGENYTGTIYIFATTGNDPQKSPHWGNTVMASNKKFCVKPRDSFRHVQSMNCPSGTTPVNAESFSVKPGVNNLYFNNNNIDSSVVALCNRTNSAINTVAMYRSGGDWHATGWYNSDPGKCRYWDVPGRWDSVAYNGDVYLHSHNTNWEKVWHGDFSFCANETSAFELDDARRKAENNQCTGANMELFDGFSFAANRGTNTYNFYDFNGKSKTKVKLCNQTKQKIWMAYMAQIDNYTGWSGHGWYEVPAEGCRNEEFTLWKNNSPYNDVMFLYASNFSNASNGQRWGGTKPMCGSKTSFQISNADVCKDPLLRARPYTVSPGSRTYSFGDHNDDDRTEVELCNETNEDLKIAYGGQDLSGQDGWSTQGWKRVPAKQCLADKMVVWDKNGNPYSNHLYFHGKTDNFVWGKNAHMCVNYDSWYMNIGHTNTSCPSGYSYVKGNRNWIVPQSAAHKIVFNYETANEPTVIKICNKTNDDTKVAFAYEVENAGEKSLTSESWVTLSAQNCHEIRRFPPSHVTPQNRYSQFYVYAEDDEGRVYFETYKPVCVKKNQNTYKETIEDADAEECPTDGTFAKMTYSFSDWYGLQEINIENPLVARIDLCNDTDEKIYAAYSYYDDSEYDDQTGSWKSRSWVEIEPDQCVREEVIPRTGNPIYEDTLFVHGEGDFYNRETGIKSLCVTPRTSSVLDSVGLVEMDESAGCSKRVYMEPINGLSRNVIKQVRFKTIDLVPCEDGYTDYGDGVCRVQQMCKVESYMSFGGSTPFLASIKSYSYGKNGRKMMEEVEGRYKYTSTTQNRYFYNDYGKVVREESISWKGLVSNTVTYLYENGGSGRLTQKTGLWASGRPTVTSYEYDSEGRVEREAEDGQNDGTIDKEIITKYDDKGRISSVETRWTSSVEMVKYEYPIDGRLIRETTDYSNDGTPDRRKETILDETGKITRTTVDYDLDGDGNEVTDYEYNSHGQLIKESTDNNSDGTYDRSVEYSYDCGAFGF